MPQKGQKAITISDDTYAALEVFADAQNKSVAGIVAWASKNLDRLNIIEIVHEENFKEALAQIIAAFESYEAFIDNMRSERFKGIINQVEFITTDWFKSRLGDGSTKQLKFLHLMIDLNSLTLEVRAEKTKLHRILGRIAPQGGESSRIIPLPSPAQAIKMGSRSTNDDVCYFIMHLEVYYGKDFNRFEELAVKYDDTMSAMQPLHSSIELLLTIQGQFKSMKVILLDGIDEKTIRKYDI